MQQISYAYKNLPIPGGGYATGFCFHEREQGLLYLRTDIGGTYRFDAGTERWKSLIDAVTMEDLSQTFPIAVATDPAFPERLYIACGIWGRPGEFCVSDDFGETFCVYETPMMIHGNLNGRGSGAKLIVDKKDSNVLYFASQKEGLWRTFNRGKSWEKLPGMKENYLTAVLQSKDGSALVVAGAGADTLRAEHLRGHSLFVSYDQGENFVPLFFKKQEICDVPVEGVKLAGLVAHRISIDEKYLYVTYAVMGRKARAYELGYSCDSGRVIGGRIARFPLEMTKAADGSSQTYIGEGEDITPLISAEELLKVREGRTAIEDAVCTATAECAKSAGADALEGAATAQAPDAYVPVAENLPPDALLEYAFGGIDTARTMPGLIVASTLAKKDGDFVFRSYDYGTTWECVLWDLAIGRMDYRAPYMRPECNGGQNNIHWLSDIKFNPFNEKEVWFNTGTGVFRTLNFTEDVVAFSDRCDGIEETVHLNLYSPPKGQVQLIDILGDLGGFAFTDLDTPCDNSFEDGKGNRYITCINADYSDENPDRVIVSARGNWFGKTKGGLILSLDQCKTWERLPMPWGISADLDARLKEIEEPNVNPGWVAMSPDGKNVIWNVADKILLPVTCAVVSHDGGRNFQKVKVYTLDGTLLEDKPFVLSQGFPKWLGDFVSVRGFKCFADRVDSNVFYGFGDASDFYVSSDGGATFHELTLPDNFPKNVLFSVIDCFNKTEVRGETGKTGVFYMALREQGLWKLLYDKESNRVQTLPLSKEGDTVYRMGLGVGRPGGDYYTEPKAIYISAILNGVYGFYRTLDEGKSFTRLNTDAQMFGDINSLEADSRTFGRFYLGTGSRGVLYGEPV